MAGFEQFKEVEDFSQFNPAETKETPAEEEKPSAIDDLRTTMQPALKAAAGFNVGVAKMAGAPVDLMNFVLEATGIGSFEDPEGQVHGYNVDEPIGGAKSLQKGLSFIGAAPQPGKEREELGKIGRVSEEVGAAAVPFGAVSTAVRLGKQGGPILKPIFDFFRTKPGTATVAELSSSVSAGGGAVLANEIWPGNTYAEMAGQLTFGLIASPSIISEFSPKVMANLRKMTKIIFTDEGAKDIAAQIVQKSTRDKGKVIQSLEGESAVLPEAKLTVGQEVGDAGLLALERSAMSKSEELKDGVAEALTQTNKAVTDELNAIKGQGNIDALRVTLEEKVSYLKSLMSLRSSQAVKAATDKLSKLAPDIPREKANEIVRKELDEAYDAGRLQEKELWESVPKDRPATIEGTRNKYNEIISSRDPVVDDPEDIPEWLHPMFTGEQALKGEQKLGRVHKLRSRILTEIRNERGKDVPNRNKMRILGEIADSTLEDMAIAAGDEVALARAFSRDFNERFTQGTVGDLMGFNKAGDPTVSSSLTLEGTVSREGPAGAVAVDDINRATGVQTSPKDTGAENVQNAIRDFVADRFLRKFPDGKINPTAGERFLNENREVLARYPALKKEIEEAVSSQSKADSLIASQGQREKLLKNKNKMAAAIFLDAPVEKEVRRVLMSRKPQAAMKSLIARAAKDTTGEATKGLKAGVVDEIFNSGLKGGRDLDMREILDGESMRVFLKSNKKAIIESGLFSPDEVKRLERTINTAVYAQRRAKTGYPGQEILDESPDAFTDLVLSVIGANIGGSSALGHAAGAPLVLAGRTAAAARNFGRKWISKIPASKVRAIINESILNKELMLELQKKPKTLDEAIAHHKALRAFLFNIAPEAYRDTVTVDISLEEEE